MQFSSVTHELARVYQSDGQVQKAMELLDYVVTVKAAVFQQEVSFAAGPSYKSHQAVSVSLVIKRGS
jgi:hypothetical protein